MFSSKNFAVGTFVIGGMLLFAIALFMIGDRRKLFSHNFEIHAEFAQLGGLQNGAKVRVGGMDAGEVLDIQVPATPASKFRVRMRVLEKLHSVVRVDSVATIQTEGVLGNKFLKIDPGTAQAPQAPAGSTVPTREPFDFADLLDQVRESVDQVRGQAQTVFASIANTSKDADELITSIKDEVEHIASSGQQISQDVNVIVHGIKAGRGTIGRLFNDETLAQSATETVQDFRQTARNLRQTSQGFTEIVSEAKERQILQQVEQALNNIRQITQQTKETIANFQTRERSGTSATRELRQTLSDAREAMSDLAENMEALKHNWFFRGFFKNRGFYDLDSITLEQYRQGKFLERKLRHRIWLRQEQLFSEGSHNTEELSQQGKRQLDSAMAEMFQYPRNSPMVVEGYSGQGSREEQWLRSYDRAAKVREYLVEKFHLNPNYIGVMPIGPASVESGNSQFREGVSLVLFYDKSD